MKYLILTIAVIFANQAFASEGLNDAFQAALAGSEQDNQKQQVAFEVAPDQIEQATFKRTINPRVVEVPSAFSTDMPTLLKEDVKIEAKQPVTSDDLAQMEKDLSDIK
jgi:hypothetical protein